MSKQQTVKRAVEAIFWLNSNEHHEVGTDFHHQTGNATHIWFRNYQEKMRVPIGLYQDEVAPHIRVNTRKFDSRMYAVKASGLRLIGEA